MKRRFAVSMLAGGIFLFLSAVRAHAQLTDTGTIAGTITDQTGAAIPDASISVINVGTNERQTAKSGAAGEYVVPSLKVGTYNLTVEKAGFETAVQNGITIDVQARVAVDIKLQVGATTQQVQVTASATVLHSQTAEIGQVVASQQIVDLPLNARQYDALVYLVAGVTVASDVWRTAAGEGYFDANGNGAMQNNYVLDGADNNSNIENHQGKSAQAGQPPVDAVAEFKLQTRTYDTEFGRSAGAVVNAQIKSGTNQIHGDGWEFLRNDHLDASNFFSNEAGLAKPLLIRNQFGGTVGGPIIKDKAFFFGAIERTPIRTGITEVGTVPTAEMQDLNFSELPVTPQNPSAVITSQYPQFTNCFTGATITNMSCIDPVGLKLLHLYPAPNTNTANDGIPGSFTGNNYTTSPVDPNNITNAVIRTDQKIGANDSLFEHFTIYHYYEHYPYIFQYSANPIADGSTDQSIYHVLNEAGATGWTHIFNPTTVLDVRLAYNRLRAVGGPYLQGTIVNPQFGINGIPIIPGISGALPEFDISGFSQLGASRWTPQAQISEVWQYRGILSKIKGKHTLKTGAEWRRDGNNYLDDCCFRGQFGFNGQYTGVTGFGITDMLLGIPQGDALSNYAYVHAYQSGLNLFGQDTWRMTPKLTVNYGLRYELVTPLLNRQNQLANFNPALNNGGGGYFEVPKDATDVQTRASVEYYKKAFAPRMGLAYRITDKLVFRSGYGIFYQNYDRRGSSADLNLNPPFLISYEPSFQPTQAPTFLLQQGFPASTLAPPDISIPADVAASQLFGQDYHTRPGMIQQSSAGFEYMLPSDMLLSASWVGNFAHRMWREVNIDQKVLTTPGQPSGDIPYPAFVVNPNNLPLTEVSPSNINWLESNGDADYNGLLVSLERKMAKGLTVLVSYTWSKGLSNYCPSADNGYRGCGPENIWGPQDKGLMPMDTPQRLVTSFTYALPFGIGTPRLNSGAKAKLLGNWQVNGILTFDKGQPLSIYANGDASQTSSGNEFANCVGTVAGGPKTVNDWFNLAPYSDPLEYTFGTCGATPGPRAPGINNIDASLYKDFRISERFLVQFRAEAYNFANHPQFGPPNTSCAAAYGQACAGVGTFGQITSLNVNTPPRQLQFGLKVLF